MHYFRYDLDQSTFSPPTEDDSFFYIRYPKPEPGPKHLQEDSNTGSVYRSINEVLQNHTLPCQDFIPSAKASELVVEQYTVLCNISSNKNFDLKYNKLF